MINEHEELLRKTTMLLDQYICVIANENFEIGPERIGFIIGCAINLLGNICVNSTKPTTNNESLKRNATAIMESVSLWFTDVIDQIEENKRKQH